MSSLEPPPLPRRQQRATSDTPSSTDHSNNLEPLEPCSSSGDGVALASQSDPSGSSRSRRRIKSHRKTRQGCYHCKRRKVKCSEERPTCTPCERNGLRCVYPLTREAWIEPLNPQPQVPQAQSMTQLHSGRLEYTALDMRLLHHFIVEAHPHLPLESSDVWTRDVPSIAHQYQFLMHSLLALSAAHFVRGGDYQMKPAAHFHRLKAIQGVNDSLSRPNRSLDDDDALICACYALCFQNAHMGDGPMDFWITVRSISALGRELKDKMHMTRFVNITPTRHAQIMTKRLLEFPLLNRTLVYEGIAEMDSIAYLCQEGLELDLFNLIMKVYLNLLSSSLKAYFAFAAIYGTVATMPADQFARLQNPYDHTIQLLHCQFLALQTLMAPILSQEWADRNPPINQRVDNHEKSQARWADTICHFPTESALHAHLGWPTKIQQAAFDNTLWEGVFENRDDVTIDVDFRDVRREWIERLGLTDLDEEANERDYEQMMVQRAAR